MPCVEIVGGPASTFRSSLESVAPTLHAPTVTGRDSDNTDVRIPRVRARPAPRPALTSATCHWPEFPSTASEGWRVVVAVGGRAEVGGDPAVAAGLAGALVLSAFGGDAAGPVLGAGAPPCGHHRGAVPATVIDHRRRRRQLPGGLAQPRKLQRAARGGDIGVPGRCGLDHRFGQLPIGPAPKRLKQMLLRAYNLSGKRTGRFAVLGKAGRFLAIPDHFGRINDNWSEPPIPGQQLQLPRRAVSSSFNEAFAKEAFHPCPLPTESALLPGTFTHQLSGTFPRFPNDFRH